MNDSSSRPSRRDWMAGPIAKRADDVTRESINAEFGPLFHFTAKAMGCEFQVLCTESGRESIAYSATDAFAILANLEQQLSIFRDTSELSSINQNAFNAPVDVEPRLYHLLTTARRISEASQGAFDVTATPLSQLWKIHRQQRTLPGLQEIKNAQDVVGWRNLFLDEQTGTIRFFPTDVSIDLGAIGKGYALDRILEFLVNVGCRDFLIHGGQSSVIVQGLRETTDAQLRVPWQVGISHPLSPGTRLATIDVQDLAIGTSGSGRQSYVVDGKRYGHVIDPRTGWPSDRLLSVTVLAKSALMADAMSTALLVADPSDAQRLCDLFQLKAILISDLANGKPRIVLINLPEDAIQLEPGLDIEVIA